MTQTPVLIVGAGPVGLALAGGLAWRGIPCLLIERGDGTITQPRMDFVGVRTSRRDPMTLAREGFDGVLADARLAPGDVDYIATTGEGENVKFATDG